MRRFTALVRTAAIEALAEPLTAVLFLSAVLSTHLLPAFHYHQMGDPARFPRECGFSSLVVFGLFMAVPAAVKAIGREIATGTAASALASGVGRGLFFCGKVSGVLLAFLLFAATVASATTVSTASCVLATDVREGVARVFAPLFAAGACGSILALAAAAAMNRFLRARFCLWACLLMAASNVLALVIAFAVFAVPFSVVPTVLRGVVPIAAGVTATACVAGMMAVCTANAGGVAAAFAVASFFAPVKILAPAEDGGAAECAVSAVVAAVSFAAGSALMRRKELP